MAFLAQLWLPVVVSAVLVFLVSAVTHMMVPFRKTEWSHLPTQDAIQTALRGASLMSAAANGVITGLGVAGYGLALEYIGQTRA